MTDTLQQDSIEKVVAQMRHFTGASAGPAVIQGWAGRIEALLASADLAQADAYREGWSDAVKAGHGPSMASAPEPVPAAPPLGEFFAASPIQSAGEAWKPIETAPKGYDVLLARKDGGIVINDWGDYCGHNAPRFTHWQPLPAAPTCPPAGEGS